MNTNALDGVSFSPLITALEAEHNFMLQNFETASRKDATAYTLRVIDKLLVAGADINLPLGLDYTALHFAARNSSVTVIRHLLDRGADPLALTTDYISTTPADEARFEGRSDIHAILQAAIAPAPSKR